MTAQTTANARLDIPRRLLHKYMADAEAAMTERRTGLGQRIASARKAKRWRQKQLAAAVSVEPMTVSRWERGQHAPDIDMLELIAQATEKPLSYFVKEPVGAMDDEEMAFRREVREQLVAIVAVLGRLETGLSGESAPPAAAEGS